MAQTKTTPFDLQSMYETIELYETYYKGKRSQRQKYIVSHAIQRFVEYNDLENPNQYLLYLIADKAFNRLESKSEQYMISELADELDKDLFLFQPIKKVQYPIGFNHKKEIKLATLK